MLPLPPTKSASVEGSLAEETAIVVNSNYYSALHDTTSMTNIAWKCINVLDMYVTVVKNCRQACYVAVAEKFKTFTRYITASSNDVHVIKVVKCKLLSSLAAQK